MFFIQRSSYNPKERYYANAQSKRRLSFFSYSLPQLSELEELGLEMEQVEERDILQPESPYTCTHTHTLHVSVTNYVSPPFQAAGAIGLVSNEEGKALNMI